MKKMIFTTYGNFLYVFITQHSKHILNKSLSQASTLCNMHHAESTYYKQNEFNSVILLHFIAERYFCEIPEVYSKIPTCYDSSYYSMLKSYQGRKLFFS